jgi:GAF domain-containing protein
MDLLSPTPTAPAETADQTIARLTAELREAHEHQTATTELLQIINSSPGDLAPVFDAMLEKAIRLCGGDRGVLWRIDGQRGHPAAARGLSAEFVALLRERGESGNPALQQVISGERLIQFADTAQSEFYRSGDPLAQAAVQAGVRSLIWVALVREDVPVGAFAIGRPQPGPFSSREIALLQNFAAQAVIAMENARLLTETREALERQTATAEVLQVINSSPGDLAPVFDAILEKAHALCGATRGALVTYTDEWFRAIATRGMPERFSEHMRRGFPFIPGRPTEQLLRGEHVHILDLPAAAADSPPELARLQLQAAELAGTRTILMVPLCKDGRLLGYIAGYRTEVRPFSDKEIALLQNFAAQAVIAIENARLLTETRETLEQQTATAEVLQVINSSPGDLAPVFNAMLEKAVRLCGASHGVLRTFDGRDFPLVAASGELFALERLRQFGPVRPTPGGAFAAIVAGEPVVHVADIRDTDQYQTNPNARQRSDLMRVRTWLAVALRREDTLLGMIALYRQEVRPFSEKEIALVQNFAAQAVIAMENARLLTETREALEQQTATAEVLQVINSSPGDLAPVFDVILEKAHSLCGAAHGDLSLAEGDNFRAVAMRGMPEALAEVLRQPFPRTDLHERLLAGFVQIPDLRAAEFSSDSPVYRAAIGPGGVRALLAVPLLKDGVLLGYLTANRREVRPFTHKQIALLQNFAAQAVIAMENARLLTETRGAADRDRRGIAGHQFLARRPHAGVRCDFGEGAHGLRGRPGRFGALRRRAAARRRDARVSGRICSACAQRRSGESGYRIQPAATGRASCSHPRCNSVAIACCNNASGS